MSTPPPGEADFGRALKALLSAAGLTPDRVLTELGDRRAQVSRTSLYDWMKNSHLPEDDGPVMEVVYLCLAAAKRRGLPVAPAPQTAGEWRRLLAAAKQARDGRAVAASRSGERSRGPSRPGMPIVRWSPFALGIHPAIGGKLPEYALRGHDRLLHALLDPAEFSSRMVVLRGKSSTGKTRAAYEAVRTCLPDWLVDYPRTPKILARRLQEGFAPRTVVWLDELRHFTSPDAHVLAELGDMLTASSRIVVIATLWPSHWAAYTREVGAELGDLYPDDEPPRSARADSLLGLKPLLAGLPEVSESTDPVDHAFGGIIDVPDRFTEPEILGARRQGNRAVVSAIVAAEAAGAPGMVTQYLAGVPDLLEHYSGPGADPYGRAVITAAMDAARFGHTGPFPEALLHQAAVGYLDDSLRTVKQERWWPPALRYATRELRGTVTALAPVPPAAGTGIDAYRLADYLDQQGRRIRQTAVGPAPLWEALAANTFHHADLNRIGQSAYDRGLYRHAAILWRRAILAGGNGAVESLLRLLHRIAPDSAGQAAEWVAAHAAADRPAEVNTAFRMLRATKHHTAASALAARAATCVPLDDPAALAFLLHALRAAGEHTAVRVLVRRLRDSPPGSVRLSSYLVQIISEVSGQRDTAALVIGSPRARFLADPASAAAPGTAGGASDPGSQAPDMVPDRHPDAPGFPFDAGAIGQMVHQLYAANAGRELAILANRAAGRFPLDDPRGVATLLRAFKRGGQQQAIARLLARRPETQVSLADAGHIASLFSMLRAADHPEMAVALGRRFAAHAPIDSPRGLHEMFSALVDAGERETASLLARRAVVRRALRPLAWNLIHTWEGVWLIGGLYSAGEREAALALAAQVAEEEGPRRPWRLNGVTDLLAIARRLRWEFGAQAAQAIAASLAHDDFVQGPLDNPRRVADSIKWLDQAAATAALETLLARQPAEHVSLQDPGGVARLLGALRRLPGTAAEESRGALLARRPQEHVGTTDAEGLAHLLIELLEEGAAGAVETLLHRITAEFDIRHAGGVPALLQIMQRAGAVDVTELARRAANQVDLTDAGDAAELLRALAELDDPQLTASAARRAAEQAVLDDTLEVARLLDAVRAGGAGQELLALAGRAADSGHFAQLVKFGLAEEFPFGREPDRSASPPWTWQDL